MMIRFVIIVGIKKMELIKTTASYRGVCCDSCQEEVAIHNCKGCGDVIQDGQEIYCESHSHCQHYHEECKPNTPNTEQTKEEENGDKKRKD